MMYCFVPLCINGMCQLWDLGIPLFDELYWRIFCIPHLVFLLVLALLIDRVHTHWDPCIPRHAYFLLMVMCTRKVRKQWDHAILLTCIQLTWSNGWTIGLMEQASLHRRHYFGWTYDFLVGCTMRFHVTLMHHMRGCIWHLLFLRIIWDPGIICTSFPQLSAWLMVVD